MKEVNLLLNYLLSLFVTIFSFFFLGLKFTTFLTINKMEPSTLIFPPNIIILHFNLTDGICVSQFCNIKDLEFCYHHCRKRTYICLEGTVWITWEQSQQWTGKPCNAKTWRTKDHLMVYFVANCLASDLKISVQIVTSTLLVKSCKIARRLSLLNWILIEPYLQ